MYPSHTFLTKFVSRGSTSLLPSRSYITQRYNVDEGYIYR